MDDITDDEWETRFPVDDYGNEIHWSLVRRGWSCLAPHGWADRLIDIACDTEV